MTLHQNVAYLLDTRAAQVALKIDEYEQSILRREDALAATRTALAALRFEEQSIIDARNLLEELA
jgi:hypothetical protein